MSAIIITGGAGFIGYNIALFYDKLGYKIIIVDDKTSGNHNAQFDYIPKTDFRQLITNNHEFADIRAIFHQGACSDTMETDNIYMIDNNFTFSKQLAQYCLTRAIPFFYASSAAVYGGASVFKGEPQYEKPLNIYGESKLLFDNWVRQCDPHHITSPLIGLRYFNVYGQYESHKGRMASVAFHHHNQFLQNGAVKLFKSSHGYENGGQKRDFIHVHDVVAVNHHFFMQNAPVAAIHNCGTGTPKPFNDIARAVVNFHGQSDDDLAQLVAMGKIVYIDFYDGLLEKYQAYTCADITSLRDSGYTANFMNLYDGVQQYCGFLMNS